MTLLELENVAVAYGRIEALHGISLTVNEGEVVALIGANGAGKTTTMRAISGPGRSPPERSRSMARTSASSGPTCGWSGGCVSRRRGGRSSRA